MEFLPSAGPERLVAAIPSYFRESGSFRLVADIPAGRECLAIRELVGGAAVDPVRREGRRLTVEVAFTADDFLKVFLFELSPKGKGS